MHKKTFKTNLLRLVESRESFGRIPRMGEKARLVSGGPTMLIVDICPSGRKLTASWIDNKGRCLESDFVPETLEVVK